MLFLQRESLDQVGSGLLVAFTSSELESILLYLGVEPIRISIDPGSRAVFREGFTVHFYDQHEMLYRRTQRKGKQMRQQCLIMNTTITTVGNLVRYVGDLHESGSGRYMSGQYFADLLDGSGRDLQRLTKVW